MIPPLTPHNQDSPLALSETASAPPSAILVSGNNSASSLLTSLCHPTLALSQEAPDAYRQLLPYPDSSPVTSWTVSNGLSYNEKSDDIDIDGLEKKGLVTTSTPIKQCGIPATPTLVGGIATTMLRHEANLAFSLHPPFKNAPKMMKPIKILSASNWSSSDDEIRDKETEERHKNCHAARRRRRHASRKPTAHSLIPTAVRVVHLLFKAG